MNGGLFHHHMVSGQLLDGQRFRHRSPKGTWKLRCMLGADAGYALQSHYRPTDRPIDRPTDRLILFR